MRSRDFNICFLAFRSAEKELARTKFIDMGTPDLPTCEFPIEIWLSAAKQHRTEGKLGQTYSFWLDGALRTRVDSTRVNNIQTCLELRNLIVVLFEPDYAPGHEEWEDYGWFLDRVKLEEQQNVIVIRWRRTTWDDSPLEAIGKRYDVNHTFVPSSERPKRGTSNRALLETTRHHFANAVTDEAEEFEPAPKVGIGALLVTPKGEFFIASRKRSPGRGQGSTFGGKLHFNETIEDGIRRLAKTHFGLSPHSFRVGPLLACTNMIIEDGHHYVDLTFLIVSKRTRPKVEIKDDSRHEPFGKRKGFWFNFTEVYEWYRSGKLFEPVANAFEQFLLFGVLSDLRLGSHLLLASKQDGSARPRSVSLNFAELPAVKISVGTQSLLSHVIACGKLNGNFPMFFDRSANRHVHLSESND